MQWSAENVSIDTNGAVELVFGGTGQIASLLSGRRDPKGATGYDRNLGMDGAGALNGALSSLRIVCRQGRLTTPALAEVRV